MGISYLPNGESWSEITRDERFYCAELYRVSKLKNEHLGTLVSLINDKCQLEKKLPVDENWEMGFEVCFYRDILHRKGVSIKKHKANCTYKNHKGEQVPIKRLPFKRTFDICLFHHNYLVIIEAKAAEGFKNKQLDDFRADIALFKSESKTLFGDNVPEVLFIGLHSSKYSPKSDTLEVFELDDFNSKNQTITWCHLDKIFGSFTDLFRQADGLYPSKSEPNC